MKLNKRKQALWNIRNTRTDSGNSVTPSNTVTFLSTGVPEEERKGTESLFEEVTTENFPTLGSRRKKKNSHQNQ